MEISDTLYNELNKGWKSTCRIVLGEEIGELKEYESWLKEYLPLTKTRVSHISGKETKLTLNGYCDSAKFISLEENKEKRIDPLTINEIKDVDSIIQAISDKWEYCGNKILGNSRYVENSDDIIDSNYISDSINVDRGSYLFASAYVTDSKYAFGGLRFGMNMEFVIKCARATACNKSFCSYWMVNSNNIYCSTNLDGCSEMMFCFNQKGKSKCIGNLALPADKYISLKKKLTGEIREELKRDKYFPFVFKLIPNVIPDSKIAEIAKDTSPAQKMDMIPIDKGFCSTFKTLFRKDVEGMTPYIPWLLKEVSDYTFNEIDSSLGSKTYRFSPKYFKIYSDFPANRVVTYKESIKLANLHLQEADLISLNKIIEKLSDIAYLTEEGETGKNINVSKTVYANNDLNAYWFAGMNNECVALCPYVFDSKYVFGCNKIVSSQQDVRCNNSSKLTRCFELDSCINCSDTYFAHNCESLSEAMFCWNVKGKRHAIGNAELQPDRYRKIKDVLVGQMADEIIKNKELDWDIFNIGCYKK